MAKHHMTEKWLRGLSARRSEKAEIWSDTGQRLPGVSLMLRRGARTMTWSARYRSPVDGSVQTLKIGRYPDMSLETARAVALQKSTQLQRGIDPAVHVRETSIPTMAEAAVAFVDHCRGLDRDGRARVKDWKKYAHVLGVKISKDHELTASKGLYTPPEWLGLSLAEIEPKMIRGALSRISDERGTGAAGKWRTVLCSMLNYALSRGWIDKNPGKEVARPARPKANRKVLDLAQASKIFRACAELDTPTARVLQMMLLTGQRAETTRPLRWDQFEENWWRIPTRQLKTERGEHLIYLGTPLAGSLIDRWSKEKALDAPLFPASHPGQEFVSKPALYRTAVKIRKMTGIEDFMPKICRPTVATCMTELGVELQHVALALDHAIPGVPAITRKHYVNNAEFRGQIQGAFTAYHEALAGHLNLAS